MEPITVSIKNWKGAYSAEFDIKHGINMIAGHNESGKSSILEAVGKTLTKQKLTNRQKQNRCANGGKCEVKISQGEDKEIKLVLPSYKVTTKDWDFKVSEAAAGLVKIHELKSTELQAMLQDHLKCPPTLKDMIDWLKPFNYSEELVKKHWEDIQNSGPNGWEQKLEIAKTEGAAYKARWKEVTGANWADVEGESWTPNGWRKELATSSIEALTEQVTHARQQRDALIASRAVDDEEVRKLHECWAGKQDLIDKLPELEKALETAEAAYDAARKAYADLPKPEQPGIPDKLYECPHCQGKMVLTGGRFEKPQDKKEPDLELIKAQTEALNEAKAQGEECKRKRDQASIEVSKVKADLEKAETAHNAWIELVKQEGGSSDQQVDEANVAVKQAEDELKAFKAWKRATELFANQKENQYLINCLDEKGLKKELLSKAIKKFNKESLKPICDIAGWGQIELHDDLTLTYDGKEMEPLCESQQHRVNVTFAVAMAYLDGSQLIIIDRIDMFDAERREQLVNLLESLDIPVLCARTVDTKDQVPPLEEYKLGYTYWLENGHLEPIGGAA